MTLPATITVEIAFDGTTWVDVTSYVRKITTRRAQTSSDGIGWRYQAGTASVTLDNTDRRFDPTNLAGPYVASGASQVKPGRPIRIRATYSATTYDLFRGKVRRWPIRWGHGRYSEVTIPATDGTAELQGFDIDAVTPTVGASELSDVRVDRILDAAGQPAGDRTLDTGDLTMQATGFGRSAWQELLSTVESEGGDLYLDGANKVVFRRRSALFDDTRSTVSQATFGDSGSEIRYTEIVPQDFDDAGVINKATVTRQGGTDQVATNTDSQTEYGPRSWRRTGLLVESDAEALNLAEFVVYTAGTPYPRIEALTVDLATTADAATKIPATLARQFGDLVTVTHRPKAGGTAVTQSVFVRGITHTIDTRGPKWTVGLTFQDARQFKFFILGDATYGQLGGPYGLTWYDGPDPGDGRIVYTDGTTMTPQLFNALADTGVIRFANAADRDAQWPDATEPAWCWLDDVAAFEWLINGAWQRVS